MSTKITIVTYNLNNIYFYLFIKIAITLKGTLVLTNIETYCFLSQASGTKLTPLV